MQHANSRLPDVFYTAIEQEIDAHPAGIPEYDLIASFWKQLGRLDKREEALAELRLEDPVDDETIKLAWRRLAMEHHPIFQTASVSARTGSAGSRAHSFQEP